MDIQTNEVIGSYRILRPLGQGGMGAVFEVEHVKLGVHYALKVYTLEDDSAELFKKKFARRQAAVEHVLTKTALSEKSKAIYRAYVLEERPIEEVAAEFGVPNNTVSQTKTRVARMIAAHEELLGE